MSKKKRLKSVIVFFVFVAVITATAQLYLPMEASVPMTLQTIGIALCGVVLGWKLAGLAALTYVFLGITGVPVFCGFEGGFKVLYGMTGGFILGLIPLAMLCGAGSKLKDRKKGLLLALLGLAIYYLLGNWRFCAVTQAQFIHGFMVSCAPYFVKDLLCIILAYMMTPHKEEA